MKKSGLPISYHKKSRNHPFAAIWIRTAVGHSSRGWLIADGQAIPVALGRGGIRANKREGDGTTPRGMFHPRQLWFRSDRHPKPRTFLPVRTIMPTDAWDENPASRHYNRPIKLNRDMVGDRLTRDDRLYDFIVEIDHNFRPRITGRGSAVFLHLARPDFTPTAGCIAMTRASMLRLLARIDRRTRIFIE